MMDTYETVNGITYREIIIDEECNKVEIEVLHNGVWHRIKTKSPYHNYITEQDIEEGYIFLLIELG